MAGFQAGSVFGEIVLRYDKATKALTTVERQTKRSMSRMTKAVQKHQEAIGAMGRSMVIASAAMGAALVAAVRQASAFEQAMRNANSIMKLTEDQFLSISEEIKVLSTELPQSAEVLAAGLYQLASGGIAAADSMDVLEAAATAAVAGVSNTATAASALITVLNTYELEARQATAVSDVLFKIVEKGVLTFEGLASSLGMVVASAAPAGVSLEEVGAAMVVMTRSGFEAALSATSLARIMETFLSPGDEFAKALKGIGIESASLFIRTEGLAAAVQALNDVAGGTPALLAAMGIEKRALRAAMALTRGEGKLFTEMLAEMQNAVGATTAAFDEQSKAFAVQWDLFRSTVNELLITLGEELLPTIQDYMDRIGAVVERTSEWSKANRALGPSLAKIATNTTLTVGAFGAMALGIKGLVALFSGPVGLIALIGSATTALIVNRKEIAKWVDSVIDAKLRILDATSDMTDAIEDTTDALASFYPPDVRKLIGQELPADVEKARRAFEEAITQFLAFEEAFTPSPEAGRRYDELRDRIGHLGIAFRNVAREAGLLGMKTKEGGEETAGAAAKTKEFTNRLEALFAEIQKLNQELRELPEGTRAYADALVELTAAQEEYNRLLGPATGSVLALFLAESKLWAQNILLDRQFRQFSATLTDWNAGVDRARVVVASLSGMFQPFIAGARQWSKSMMVARQQLQFFMNQVVAMTGGVFPGFDMFKDIQEQIVDLQFQLSKGLIPLEAVAATKARIEELRVALATLSDVSKEESNEISRIWQHTWERIQDGFANTIERILIEGGGLVDWWRGINDIMRKIWAELLASMVTMWLRDFIAKIAAQRFGIENIFGAAVAGATALTVVASPTVATVALPSPDALVAQGAAGMSAQAVPAGAPIAVTINAVDAASFSDLLARNPKLIANAVVQAFGENSPLGRRGAR